MPGRLVFSTTADGASSPTERMRINSSGDVLFFGNIRKDNASSSLTVSGGNGSSSGANIVLNGQSGSPANTIQFRYGSNESMRIDSSGKVGLGATDPSSYNILADNLVIKGTSHEGITIQSGNSSSGNIWFSDADAEGRGQITYHHLSDVLYFSTAGSEALRIDSSGNVGIGTTSPSANLHVVAPNNSQLFLEATDTSPTTIILETDAGTSERTRINNKDGDITFDVSNTAEALRIDSSGNVGIGETSPSYKLHVKTGQVMFQETAAASNAVLRLKGSNTSTGGAIIAQSSTNGSAPLEFYSGTSQTMKIDSSGRLLVGTSSSIEVASTAPSIMQVTHAAGNISAAFYSTANNAGPAGVIALGHGRNSTSGLLSDDDVMGQIRFAGADGTDMESAGAQISAEVDGTPGSNDMPGRLVFSTTASGASSATERMRIDRSGRVGIGVTPASILHVKGTQPSITIEKSAGLISGIVMKTTGSSTSDFILAAASGESEFFSNQYEFKNVAGTTEYMMIDSSGRLLVGTSSARSVGSTTLPRSLYESTTHTILAVVANHPSGGTLCLGGTGGSSVGSNTLVSNNQTVGGIRFAAADGANLQHDCARISAQVDGTPGANDIPGRLVFSTTADGASSPTERMRIMSGGNIVAGNNSAFSAFSTETGFNFDGSGTLVLAKNSNPVLYVGRQGNDGDIVRFMQAGTQEGNINVSGSTVTLNGAHLSRWSQLPNGAERAEILRGTVLSNIDEMCEWGEEDNEQLNRMKVSDVEGDRNVAGVFQSWDDDDDTYTDDFYCAMTGDFVIRIAPGTTVARGDLLMSAGDGTAKPQDDDIIRSKTIAKVTSTHISETYADGSYCVPCVLMAC